MRRRTPILALATLLLPHALVAQSASEILNTATERYEARMADVDNYTVVQNLNGTNVTLYFEKVMRNGHPTFEPSVVGAPSMPQMQGGDRFQRMRTAGSLAEFADRAELTGTESVGGQKAWVIQVNDLSGMGMDQAGGFEPKSMTLYVGQDEYTPLQMKMSGELTRDGETHPVDMTTRMEDYREVKGLLYPFKTSVTMEGMGDAMSSEERGQMQQQMEEMKKRLADMPPEQRAMIEQQMKNMPGMANMMEQMESASAGGPFEMTIQVEEVRVNEGKPSGD